jgi:hypothetical protein
MFKYESCTDAAGAGDLEELKKMHEAGCPWDTQTTENAARKGHLNCLRYAHLQGCEWQIMTTQCAAFYGHFDCLEYAVENGCPTDDLQSISFFVGYVPAFAASSGSLKCLQYLHLKGIQWDHKTVEYSASANAIECLKYAIENGCPWDERATKEAVKKGNIESFKILFEASFDLQEFWNTEYNLSNIIDKIDLDDKVWRKLFTLDLSKNPDLQNKVETKKQKIQDLKSSSNEVLQTILPVDIIHHCIHPLF